MDNEHIIKNIKSSFCNLTTFKVRQNALEVVTAYSTINNKFVSVFITYTRDKIVLTDSGWIYQNYYDTPFPHKESEDIVKRIILSYQTSFNVKKTSDKAGVEYYYKTCERVEQIPSLLFDLANFIVGAVNASCIQYKDEKEEKQRENFRKDADSFLKVSFLGKVQLKHALDDFKNIKFNAIITGSASRLCLLNYVTGTTQSSFENDLRKSIVNFEIAEKSQLKDIISEKITIINDNSEGYLPEKSALIFDLLKEKTTREPIKWTEKEQIFNII